ncbi:ABC-2 type transport system ATP-binding protein [Kitasatospora sp. GAS204A]|uniref:ABC transporter ATP-binding protein n=1 Tax=unclassified Kitasatospora TaxID=2633591 RepID=UPI0024764861|nr:ABC transporter ATP-binding protein [Kitasatospora sp. GAS204B]MDH6117974.1 ABC-2 type transport system ATP-binding protein [Kitasatospora sp. GAS204B]
MEALRLTEVGKRYGRSGPWVLRGVGLALEPGALVRIAGANGSGKSTLLKLVGGIEPPSRGRLRVAGRRAYVPERFPPALPFDPAGYLRHLGRIHGLSTAVAADRAEFWLDRFGITDRAGTPLARLSKGTCQKVAVAQALLAEADVLLLDEAWTGLDQAARTTLDEAAMERAGAGGVVLFVDHDPNRLAGLTSRAFQLRQGGLTEVQPPGAEEPRELMSVLVAAGELPEWLPGTPEREDRPDGTVLLRVAAGQSDALLRRLLTAPAELRILDVSKIDGAPVGKPVSEPADAPEVAR